jgi:hypothetical protein
VENGLFTTRGLINARLYARADSALYEQNRIVIGEGRGAPVSSLLCASRGPTYPQPSIGQLDTSARDSEGPRARGVAAGARETGHHPRKGRATPHRPGARRDLGHREYRVLLRCVRPVGFWRATSVWLSEPRRAKRDPWNKAERALACVTRWQPRWARGDCRTVRSGRGTGTTPHVLLPRAGGSVFPGDEGPQARDSLLLQGLVAPETRERLAIERKSHLAYRAAGLLIATAASILFCRYSPRNIAEQ